MFGVNRLRIILILLAMVCYLGGISSVIAFSIHRGSVQLDMVFVLLCIIIVNTVSARYLYRRASTRKQELALFGLIGNVTAILAYWLWKNATTPLEP